MDGIKRCLNNAERVDKSAVSVSAGMDRGKRLSSLVNVSAYDGRRVIRKS